MAHSIDESYFKKLAKKFSILYISEEKPFAQIEEIFTKIFTCKTEEEALKIFTKESVDIVFIDVDTKNLSWLYLVKNLRKISYDIPISIITDLTSSDRLTTAITIGITQCIFKPIDDKRSKLTIYDIANKLQHKLDAKELFYKKEEEKLEQIATKSAENIIKDIPLPMFVFQGNNILFANKELYKLFEAKKIDLLQTPTLNDITKLFENYSGANSFETIRFGKSIDVQYHYQDYSLKKVFIPNKFEVTISGSKEKCSVIVLSDIAPFLMQMKMMQYQTNKLENYKSLIEELLAKQLFRQTNTSIITPKEEEKSDNKFSDKEIQVLRKSVVTKIQASEYVSELDHESYEDVHELSNIEEDLQIAIDSFVISGQKHELFEISKLLKVYGGVITGLVEFIDLGNSICSLSDFLLGIDEKTLNESAQKIALQCETILSDLIQWRVNIFETQVALDIHYLDSSIFSSVLQLQLNLSEDEDEGEELELF